MKRRILFVDDEPLVLAGLRRMLRPMSQEWAMEFVTSGAEALATMEKTAFDAVVSDMRMPAMNGAQLLQEVAQRHPQTARFILSGQADQQLILQCVGTAHQFLSKPCQPELLKAALQRVFTVERRLQSSAMKELVSRLTTVPSPPPIYLEITRQLSLPHTTVENLGGIIAQDPGMTAKVLQLVNSAFFGSGRRIANPSEAVMLLGLDTIRTLVLWIHIFSSSAAAVDTRFSLERLSSHCLTVGVLARQILRRENADLKIIESAMTAGLLHDLGILLLAANCPQLHHQCLDLAAAEALPLWQAEHQVLGTSHSEIGAYLLALWGLPFDIVESVALHHCPQECGNSPCQLLMAVHVADALAHESTRGEPNDHPGLLDMDYLTKHRLVSHLEGWRQLAKETHTPDTSATLK